MTYNFYLDLKALKACSYAMSDDSAREYLCGVHIFERNGAVLYEACNGHIAVRTEGVIPAEEMSDQEEHAGMDFILPAFIVNYLCKKAFMKGFGVEATFVQCHVDALRINVEGLHGLINYKLLDATYPNIDDVIPKRSSITFNKINVNGKYMDAMADSIAAVTGSKIITLQFTGDSYGSPILIKSDKSRNWMGVLMPVTLFDAEDGVETPTKDGDDDDENEEDEIALTPLEQACKDAGAVDGKNWSEDDLYTVAVELVRTNGRPSTSFIQRHLQIGYNRAARLIEKMEERGVISMPNHVGKRVVLATPEEVTGYEQWVKNGERGLSAKALAAVMLGAAGDGKAYHAYPHDASDFGRCLNLLSFVPSWTQRLPEMSRCPDHYGEIWGELGKSWEQMTRLYNEGNTDDLTKMIAGIVKPIEDRSGKVGRLRGGASISMSVPINV